ncbi:hypothetical protein SAMN04487857_111133 [Pseudomonas sp. ok272]|uniref:hypothetical protein n=1 Tax=unclassified Pseudomonas TaxID=196821 RepID=UPI0008C113C1|nr:MULTISPECIES: hypothetical protein [unclassified Pseudomonas]SEN19362.1 hypothetical protein SAMN04487857_111133 [Pseudomonas sp. ok272]SFN11429.1 hypothetical protein SAMN04487858_112133 [Pseudomonas sp. ok602]
MTTMQICALISTIIAAALLYWTGYRGGLVDGRYEGKEEGKNTERADNAKTINELKASLQFIRGDHQRLAQLCKQLKTSQTLSPDNHENLLAIAEKLKLAADTFRAVNSQCQATQALALRNKALSMAAQLEPAAQEDAA